MMTLYFRKFEEQNIHFQVEDKTHQSAKNPKKQIGGLASLLILAMTIWALSEEREQKLRNGLAKIHREHYEEVCEQYVLKAKRTDWYPCPSCQDSAMIFLKAGEVWKYGITGENGQEGRYPNSSFYKRGKTKLGINDLEYLTQFRGNRAECLKEELRKIILYPELPECQLRNFYLERPPGNPQDR